MNGEFEWTESGLRLLDTIKSIIHKEGGRLPLAVKIMKEDKEHFQAVVKAERNTAIKQIQRNKKRGYTAKRDQMIIDHWYTHSLQEIASMIGDKHLSAVSRRGYALGLPPRSFMNHTKSQVAVPVIISYPNKEKMCWSLTEAALELKVTHAYIHKAISKGYRAGGYKIRLAEAF